MRETFLDAGLPPVLFLAGALIVALVTALGSFLLARCRPVDLPGRIDAVAARQALPRFGTALLIVTYLTARLVDLTRLPVFIDEAFHILWAQQPTGRYLLPQLLVGKWLPVQLMSITLSAPCEPLCAARLATVLAGLGTLLACMRIQMELFASAAAALLSGVLYLILPFGVLYERMALADPYVTVFGAWSVCFALQAARAGVLAHAGWRVLGMTLCVSAATLSKPTGAIFILVPLLVTILLVEPGQRTRYLRLTLPATIGGVALVGYLFAGGYGTGLLTSQVTLAPTDRISLLLRNLRQLEEWLNALVTREIVVAGITAVIWASLRQLWGGRREAFLVSLILLATAPYLLLGHTWYPHYVHFLLVPLALLLGQMIDWGSSTLARLLAHKSSRLEGPATWMIALLAVSALGLSCVRKDLRLLSQPENAGLPAVESVRFISGGLSGYGLPEVAEFLRQQAMGGPLHVVRFDLVGPAHQGLEVYLQPSERLRLSLVDPVSPHLLSQLAERAAQRRTLFLSNPDVERDFGLDAAELLIGSQRVWQHKRPWSSSGLEVWEIAPP